MCECVNVDVGSYANQVALDVPPWLDIRANTPERELKTAVSVDRCLADEIQHLWWLGIVTTGCCCGHNKLDGFIGVQPEFIGTMIGLGYEVARNRARPGDSDSFYPKTPGCRGAAWASAATPTKALAIKQPWAEAIVRGWKDVENRNWRTRYRGPVLIHASKLIEPAEEIAYFNLVNHRRIAPPAGSGPYYRANLVDDATERCGGIIGVADIVDCVEQSDSPWFVGRYGFVLANARSIDLIPCRGMQSLFSPPADVLSAARAALGLAPGGSLNPETEG